MGARACQIAFGLYVSTVLIAAGSLERHTLASPSLAKPVGWEPIARQDVSSEFHYVTITVAIVQPGADIIDPALLRVSDPDSDSYGKYWTLEQMTGALAAQDNADRVLTWLAREGDPKHLDVTVGGEFVRAVLPVAEAEHLFGVSLKVFRHRTSNAIRFAVESGSSYSVPQNLSSSIEFIVGLNLPRASAFRSSTESHAQDRALQWLRTRSGNSMKVLLAEARDRAFQVHVVVQAEALQGFEAVLQQVSDGFKELVSPVRLNVPVREGDCTPGIQPVEEIDSKYVTCVVQLGPSLSLINFAPTRLWMRAALTDGGFGDWYEFEDLIYTAQTMTVSDVRRLYGVPNHMRNRVAHNSQATANFLNISASTTDALAFQRAMGMRRQPSPKFEGDVGQPGIEGNIDLQWIQAMGNNVQTTVWSTPGGHNAHEPFLDWLISLANTSHPPLVHSVSYGENEEDYSLAYERRANLELAKLGLRGVTIVVATGDTGIQGAAQGPPGTPPRCAPFAPVWPASSPYVTSVGATMISNRISEICSGNVFAMGTNSSMPFLCPDSNIAEIVCSTRRGAMITSGGGFSERFARPSYQRAAVEEYLEQIGIQNASLFNRGGRAYPDLSAVGQNVPIVFQGRVVMVGGTSSSSPIVAGLLSLLNGQRLLEGYPPLGFINPLLYKSYELWPEIVQDVVTGNNSGGNQLLPESLNRNCPQGFSAEPGWDATTGLGSPNLGEMLKRLVQIPFTSRRDDRSTVV